MLAPCFIADGLIEAGCDEAGRGCLAGPVVAAAVILDPENPITGLEDSKKLTEKQRLPLADEIREKAMAFAVGVVDHHRIDEINILKASFEAMHMALNQLNIVPDRLLIDGNRFVSYHTIPHHCLIKGDGRFQSIAAASILAKTFRDQIMENLHSEFPVYNWSKNKGYPTLAHRSAIEKFGSTPYHRMTFNLLGAGKQLKLF